MKCEYCELRRIGPFAIPKSCTILSGKLLNKQTGEPLKICMHHTTFPDPEPEETQAAAPTPVQNPTGKPLDLKNRGKQAPAAAAELVPGRDYDPDTGEVYETAGQPTDDRQTTGGRNNMKVVKIAPAKEA
ncbi:hypothetical protein G4974_06215 [[Ruminococcus] gnavus]|uniref:Uncharacterized protein n=1 Tax=Mediterraneibacter gnavus TaxID=33038 RepID=A0AAJ1AZ68_MEDGN|nr:hypothetical protein [Mediterraneibacter gnavus]MCC3676466.1 hypothetical protein [[Clostridium] nexile]MCB5493891.1 hypothetical protein [Mediterraneibacter gnavus]MCB5593157.1 hypothetical protein [Mediterraneibacter gnavus]MCB5605930.1 hypothetical protein [Mediterraneibacter gnavus]MCG4522903.1 hypothetical protein [Mediterraneibacter gnavus]